MSFFYSDDPARDAERYAAEQDKQIEILPKCAHCGHEIQDERLFDFNGELYHIECAKEEFLKWTEDYIE
jgi:hypothetical protein